MQNGDRCLFGGQIVVIRGSHIHAVTGKARYLIEHSDKTFSKVGAESLAPLTAEVEPEQPFGVGSSMLRQGEKRKVVLK